jgi:hypothetical protein
LDVTIGVCFSQSPMISGMAMPRVQPQSSLLAGDPPKTPA